MPLVIGGCIWRFRPSGLIRGTVSILVTGGAGFIGSNFVLEWMATHDEPLVNLDKLTYAGNRDNLISVQDDPRYRFVRGDIGDRSLLVRLLREHQPRAVVHFAAESHVDRSIMAPDAFMQTNVMGTFGLLEAVQEYWEGMNRDLRDGFRFLHVSTDEVFGSLKENDPEFDEYSPYRPNSPYAASKAASDHLVRAYHHTYGLPTVTSNCSNNYGPYQFPEKLIPLVIHRARSGQLIPVYGDGLQIRDWLHVSDHCAALRRMLAVGEPGAVYAVGGSAQRTNVQVVEALCALLGEARPGVDYFSLVRTVKDRPGHDRRYAVNASRTMDLLGWAPQETFASGLRRTMQWYLDNNEWVSRVTTGAYREWMDRQYPASLV